MRKVITIQIIRPNFEDMDELDKKILIEKMAISIAEQITKQESLRQMNEDIKYWQKKFMLWEIEDQFRKING